MYQLPGGAAAQVAVYTEYAHHFAIIRRILLRMRSWQNYVFFEGHGWPGNRVGVTEGHERTKAVLGRRPRVS